VEATGESRLATANGPSPCGGADAHGILHVVATQLASSESTPLNRKPILPLAFVVASCVPTGDTRAQQPESIESRLRDASHLLCTTDRGIAEGVDKDGNAYAVDVVRLRRDWAEFRVRYQPSDDEQSAYIWVGATGLERFDQMGFPPYVGTPSLTFIRTSPVGVTILQLDSLDGDTLNFARVEREGDTASVAHGTCRLVE
jgi:hypothetical protein